MHLPFDEHGILLRRTAVAYGIEDDWLHRLVREGALVRMRHGAYVDPAIWLPATAATRHVLLGRAVMQQYDDRVALSHGSAHVRRGGPDWGLDLSTVNLTNLVGRGDRKKAGITHHRGWAGAQDVTRTEDHWITAPGRTAAETASLAPLAPAVCVLDWTLHEKLTTPAELERYAQRMSDWSDSPSLQLAVPRCDGRSESVGESRARLVFGDHGFGVEPQFKVFHPSGRLAGRVDLLVRELELLVEFDGAIKYGRLLTPGQTIDDVIRAERAREVLLEELTGLRMFRIVWADLDRPRRLIDRAVHASTVRRAG
ncbi:MAG TPA: type IV toxin-antitoxin system AbiEi family antitoxin domain-containing protein [Nocardioides sp.]|nr:type IV toxin-antitoxin system AbiEi family antitoxin domain-containing protein [Nocardioides sp.]